MNDKTGNDVGLNDVTSMSPQLKWMTQKPCGLYHPVPPPPQSGMRHLDLACVYIYIYQRKSTMRRVCIPWTPFLSFFNSQHLLLFISQCLQLLSLFPIHSFIHSCAFLMCVYNTPEPLFSFTNLPEKWTNDNMHDECGVKKRLDAALHSWNCTTDEKEPTTICQISRLVGLNRETTWIK
jgi:hypothetical protein